RTRADAPFPVCWAPRPKRVVLRGARAVEEDATASPEALQASFERAHPSWVLPCLPAGQVRIEGCSPEGEIAFELPRPGVVLDCETPRGESALRCPAARLVLLPEERRFYLVFVAWFETVLEGELSFRLRTEEA
ncbi:MAG TPA: DUF2169 domain-containing protein, partial [Minicystis sp.]|nr:DUF2169 domain-containing protein [Minicystis sp.]